MNHEALLQKMSLPQLLEEFNKLSLELSAYQLSVIAIADKFLESSDQLKSLSQDDRDSEVLRIVEACISRSKELLQQNKQFLTTVQVEKVT
jgi:hypothetical protein